MKYAPLAIAALLAACSKPAEMPASATDSAATVNTAEPSDAAAAVPSAAIPNGPVSQYTSLEKCKVIDDGSGEDFSISRCAGLGGYTLQLNYFDARESLDVIRGGKVIGEMKLWLRGGGGFNALGDTVEWRGTMQGGAFVPRALIVRNYVVRDASQPERSVGVLEVVDLTRGCMAGSVEPGADQNAAARALADAPPVKCVSYRPER